MTGVEGDQEPARSQERGAPTPPSSLPATPLRPARMLAYTRDMSTTTTTKPSSYNPLALLKALLALLALLLGLTLWLGGWQPHTSDARLGWSHGTIDVIEGTDGDTGARPLSPHDEGVRPAPDTLPKVDTVYTQTDSGPSPVDHWETFFEGSGPGGASVRQGPAGSAA